MKNHKSFLAGMLTMLLIMGLVGTASATGAVVEKEIEYRDIKVSLDGTVLALRDAQGNAVEPFMFDGTNYIPARALAEALGLTVAWDSANSTVVLTHPQAAAPQPESVPAPEPAPIEAPSAEPEGAKTVYVTRTGQRYHYSSTCNGGTYYESTLEAARARGLTPCDKCVLTN